MTYQEKMDSLNAKIISLRLSIMRKCDEIKTYIKTSQNVDREKNLSYEIIDNIYKLSYAIDELAHYSKFKSLYEPIEFFI